MSPKVIKVGATAIVLATAFGGLLWFSLKEDTAYYKHVDEVMVSPQQWEGKSLQLHGFVVPGTWVQKPNTLEYRFKIENNGSVVNAFYMGILPDTFKDEAEVVLKGRLTPDGFQVVPGGVMAKCPSKYEPQPGTTTSN